jgi:acylphosphatase
MKRSVKILVYGRVQGVYFRKFTHHKAKQLGVTGTVMNLPDGGVEIVAQAEAVVLQTFIDWCHKGPITARVDRVEITELQADELLVNFVIQ